MHIYQPTDDITRHLDVLLVLDLELGGGAGGLVDGLLLERLHVAGVLLSDLHAKHADEEDADERVAGGEHADGLDLVVLSDRLREGRGLGKQSPGRLGVGQEGAEALDVDGEVEHDDSELERDRGTVKELGRLVPLVQLEEEGQERQGEDGVEERLVVSS